MFEKETQDDASTAPAAVMDAQARSAGIGWTVVSLLVIVGLIFSIVMTTQYKRSALPTEVRDTLTEVDAMKQELQRMQEQNEAIQRERDNAMAAARQVRENQEQEVQQAVDAARREFEALRSEAQAAEQAAEEAAKEAVKEAAEEAAKEAEEVQRAESLALEQLLEEQKRRTRRERLERKRLEAELEQQRLEREKQQSELNKARLELERITKEMVVEETNQKLVAEESAE